MHLKHTNMVGKKIKLFITGNQRGHPLAPDKQQVF